MLYLTIIAIIVVTLWLFVKGLSSSAPEKIRKVYKYTAIAAAIIIVITLFRVGLPYIGTAIAALVALVPYLGRIMQLINALRFIKRFTPKNKPNVNSKSITKKEAREILGVSDKASEKEIKDAYHKLMKKNHPDTGGSKYLASQLNKAKDALLKR